MVRSQVRTFRLRWPVLRSVALHVLAVIALNSMLIPANVANTPEAQRAIRVFFPLTGTGSEVLQTDVSPEMTQIGERSDGLSPFLAQESEPHFPLEGERISEPIPLQVGELSKPPDPRPPTDAPEVSPPPDGMKDQTPRGARSASALPSTPPTRPQSPPSPQRAPGAKQTARGPGISEPVPRDSSNTDQVRDVYSKQKPLHSGVNQSAFFGRVPLSTGDDPDKYAMLPSPGQHRNPKRLGGVDTAISLNTKDIKYLAYFAHIKDRIERVWSYPSAAVTQRLQGQLSLLFILQRSGQVKSVELLRSSGAKVLDQEAWDAIMTAGPFDPFPPHIPQDELHIRARFSYLLDTVGQRTTMQ
jgi:periplasmic protein TonB